MAVIRRHEQDLRDILRHADATLDMGPGYHAPLKMGRHLLWLYDRPEQPAEDMRLVADDCPAENLEELDQ